MKYYLRKRTGIYNEDNVQFERMRNQCDVVMPETFYVADSDEVRGLDL